MGKMMVRPSKGNDLGGRCLFGHGYDVGCGGVVVLVVVLVVDEVEARKAGECLVPFRRGDANGTRESGRTCGRLS